MKNRAFGVELEFNANGIGASGVANLMIKEGFNHDWLGDSNDECCYDDFCDCGGEDRYSNIGWDGSEIEVRTPILEGPNGFKDLKRLVEVFNRNDFYTTTSDGLHVHHNAPEFVDNKPLIVKLLKSWKYNEQHISRFIDEQRADWAINETYDSPCPTFTHAAISNYENLFGDHMPGYSHGFQRNNLNVNSLMEHGTIEFRYHEGTLNWSEIESWILFGQSFINGVVSRKNPIMPADNPVILMNRLKTNNRAKVVLARKAGLTV